MTRISFGTSGWRGIIARDFTWEKVDRVVDSIAVFLLESGCGSVAVGGDTRFLSPEMARDAAGRLARAGLRVLLSDRPVPTPVLSHAVRTLGLGGAVNFTASHNPFMYNGIKFSPSHGGPAPSPVTSRIEALIEAGAAPSPGAGEVEITDFVTPYTATLQGLVDRAALTGVRVVYDPFNGTGAGITDRFLVESGASVRTIHEVRDPLFAGRHPEPNRQGLADLSAEVSRSGASLGVATDGDADRFGLVDETGTYISPHDFLALLFEHLVTARGMRGACVRSVTTGSLVDRVAAAHGMETVVTPVGFKHLGAVMLEGGVVLAGEESGGLSIGGHVPEKDGILACLLAAEMTGSGEGLGRRLEALWARFGRLHHRRLDIPLRPRTAELIRSTFLGGGPPALAGRRVVGTDSTDGTGLRLEDGSGVLVRMSGTEPLARFYLESSRETGLDELEAALDAMLEPTDEP
jgi:phosphoglucomutase